MNSLYFLNKVSHEDARRLVTALPAASLHIAPDDVMAAPKTKHPSCHRRVFGLMAAKFSFAYSI